MAQDGNIWVGIEVSRQIRVADGGLASVGGWQVGGVNLLEHQIKIALQVAPAHQVCVLTPQGDERVLELVAKYEVRELAPYDFIAMLSDRARRSEDGAVVLLRQIAPLRDARDLQQALKLLEKTPVVISASKPPAGHKRHQPLPEQAGPDYRCLAFEARRINQFSAQAIAAAQAGQEELLFTDWDSFAEIIRPDDEDRAVELMRNWP